MSAAVVGMDARARLERAVTLLSGRAVCVLTGAGCSTESGIPDYRGPETRRRARHPIQHREFLTDPRARQRYWARSMLGWPRFAAARPNAAHFALAQLERAGIACGVITQNVDGLHQRAGSRSVVDLHGRLSEVCCLSCGRLITREALQADLLALNPGWGAQAITLAPDGDAELPEARARAFRVPACRACGGMLKPQVVFFGGQVPQRVAAEAWGLLAGAEALLVVGSSLAVLSGYRFVRAAAERALPVAIISLGATRGDSLASVCIDDARAGTVLPWLAARLGADPAGGRMCS